MALPADTRLNERYTIRRALRDAGPFATTYLAYDEEEEQEVVVAEYFPPHLAERSEDERTVRPAGDEEAFRQGMKYFCKEAKQLRAVDHPNLASERESFEANGTSYRVNAYRAGASLATALEKNDGSVSERAALTVMKPVLGALHALHRQGLLHGGLTPEAIYLTESRKVLVRDVRGAQLQLARKTDALDAVVVAGMSPAEQYDKNGRQGPWTDVYAAAATFYRAVTGQALPEACEPLPEETIAEHLKEADGLSEGVKRVLKRALAPRPRGRMQSAQALWELLEDPSLEDPSRAPGAEEEDASTKASAAGASAPASTASSRTPANPGAEMWGPASMAAAAAEAVKEDKEKMHERRKEDRAAARLDRSPADGEGADGEGADYEAEEVHAGPTPSRALMGGGAALLVVLLVGAGLFFTGFMGGNESNAEGSAGDRYAKLIAEGDSLYDQSDYQDAAARYERARELSPEDVAGDARVTERLLTVDRLQDAITKENYQRAMRHGDELKFRADSLADADHEEQAKALYARASTSYLKALEQQPADSVASGRVQMINGLLGGGNEGNASSHEQYPICSICGRRHKPGLHKRVASFYRRQGEKAFEEGNYEEAQRKFKEVLTHSPGDEGATAKLEKIGTLLSKEDRRKQYRHYRQRADALYEKGQLAEARSEYQLALEANPGDATVKRRLSSIDQRQEQQRERQEQYQYHRSRGDVRFEDGRLKQAIQSYQKAMEYRPDDSYAQQRVARAKKVIAAEKEKAKEKAKRTENGIYTVTDEEPKIVGGRSALYDNISYPARARRRGVEGRVYLRATVGADGVVQNVEVLRGIGYGADEEALRALQKTKFRPGTIDGSPVPAFRTIMVEFKIN